MDASNFIRDSVMQVAQLRETATKTPELALALTAIKQFQSRRFAGTYSDLLQEKAYGQATRFFLDELYSAKDYARRDAQFARIAGALERIFPQPVVDTAISLAQLHLLTETLDLAMAEHWCGDTESNELTRYVKAWRALGRREDRHTQLAKVIALGQELDHLTRTPGLRMMLKLMRGPANLAGLGELQHFLEAGFDTFASMGRQAGATRFFMQTVQQRESRLFEQLFDAELVTCETELARTLSASR